MIFSKSLFLLTASFAAAQTFEVASVKPAAPYKGGPIHIATTGGTGTGDPPASPSPTPP